MTEKMTGIESLKKSVKKSQSPAEAEQVAVRELVRGAQARGEDLTCPDGLLKSLTKTLLETALDEEMTEYLGCDKHAVEVSMVATRATAPAPRRC